MSHGRYSIRGTGDPVLDPPLLAAMNKWMHNHACPACEREEAEIDNVLLCETMRTVLRAVELLNQGDPSQEI